MGENELGLLNQISVYPNPGRDKVYIKSPIPIMKATLVDLSGKQFEMKASDQTLNFSGFAKGLYFLKLETNSGNAVFKIMIE